MKMILKYVEDEIEKCKKCLEDMDEWEKMYLLAVHVRMTAFLEIRNLLLGL